MEQEEKGCKVCTNVDEGKGPYFCENCSDGPFCRYCLVMRHGIPCGKKSWLRRLLELFGLERTHDASYVTEETWRLRRR